ncbi:MAG: 16S rRNA (guanine(966)-N(2))-methyltransferase RsmD [Kyrpidia sp.]|nr:16S rRNA (guanine(966)-N(2))-methyltransferase RsmD [Kyrpidia sp.]
MRVIAGTLRGHPLASVPGRGTRPTSDRVKEAMFSILGGFLDGGRVLDGFAGTGALGIEAMSRGADRAVFVERSPAALKALRANLSRCGLEGRAQVLPMDFRRAVEKLASGNPPDKAGPFEWIFLDPPYKVGGLTDLLVRLAVLGLAATDAVAVLETSVDTLLPERAGPWIQWKRSTYGDTALTFYRRESTE